MQELLFFLCHEMYRASEILTWDIASASIQRANAKPRTYLRFCAHFDTNMAINSQSCQCLVTHVRHTRSETCFFQAHDFERTARSPRAKMSSGKNAKIQRRVPWCFMNIARPKCSVKSRRQAERETHTVTQHHQLYRQTSSFTLEEFSPLLPAAFAKMLVDPAGRS